MEGEASWGEGMSAPVNSDNDQDWDQWITTTMKKLGAYSHQARVRSYETETT